MPRLSFENKVTFGNILTIAAMLAGLVVGYISLSGSVAASADAVKAIPGIESRVSTIETRINIGQAAREQFQNKTEATLDKLQAQNSLILQQIAALNATLKLRDIGQ